MKIYNMKNLECQTRSPSLSSAAPNVKDKNGILPGLPRFRNGDDLAFEPPIGENGLERRVVQEFVGIKGHFAARVSGSDEKSWSGQR